MGKRPADNLKTFWKDIRRVTSLERPQDVNFVPLVQMRFYCIIFNFISPNVCLKHKRVSCFIVLGFWRNVHIRWATFLGRPQEVDLNISSKRISVVTFSVLVPQVCLLDTKKLVILYSFSFGDTSYERPNNVPKWHLQRDVTFHKITF